MMKIMQNTKSPDIIQKDTEISILKQALRDAFAEIKHLKFCKSALEGTKDVMQMNIDLMTRQMREKDEELVCYKRIVSN